MKVKELKKVIASLGDDVEIRFVTIGEAGGTFTSEPARNYGVNGTYFDRKRRKFYIMEGAGGSKKAKAKDVWKKFEKKPKPDERCAGLINWFKD